MSPVRRKRGMCKCLHGPEHHTGPGGACVYGHGTLFGGCTWCPKQPGNMKPKKTKPHALPFDHGVAPDPVAIAIDDIILGFRRLRVALAGLTPAAKGIMDALDMPAAAPQRTPRPSKEGGSTFTPTKCEMAIIRALGERSDRVTSDVQLGLITKYAARGKTMSNALSRLRAAGLIDGGRQGLHLTGDALLVYPPPPTPRRTRDNVIGEWSKRLPKASREILATVEKRHPDTVDRDDLAAATGYVAGGKTMSNALSQLRSVGLLDRGGKGVCLGPELLSL